MNKELLTALCQIDGLPGHEKAVREYIVHTLEATGNPMEITVDAMGNVIVHLIGKQPAVKKVLLDAHMDEVGFIVTYINQDGTLKFDTLGGMSQQVLFGHRVRIGDCLGVIGGKAVHQCGKDEKKKVPSVDGMCIDIGCANAEEAARLVEVGDVGTFAVEFNWYNEDIFCGKAVDDRFGCAILLELAKTQPQRDIWLSFTVQEELGCRGAGIAAEAVAPDYAVAIDATTAADTAGNSGAATVCCMGKGAVVPFADGGTLYEQDLYRRTMALAAEKGIPVQTKSLVAGGNNAAAIQRRGSGIRTVTVSLACRYIHSPACMGSMKDVENIEKLITLLVEELTQ